MLVIWVDVNAHAKFPRFANCVVKSVEGKLLVKTVTKSVNFMELKKNIYIRKINKNTNRIILDLQTKH